MAEPRRVLIVGGGDLADGSDADAVAVREGRPELLLPDGEHEPFPLEIAK